MLSYLPHFAYVLMLGAFLTRDVLWLRALLVAAQSMVAYYTFRLGVLNIAIWNSVFMVINFVWMIRILRERRGVQLSTELRALYDKHFSAMSPPEFLRWWKQGQRDMLRGERLVTADGHPADLFFVLDGNVQVSRQGEPVTLLSAGSFVAEMSLLTGRAATADASAIGDVAVVRWSVAGLHELRRSNPVLWTKIQSVLGYDLVQKIQRSEKH
jgi:hypothetical protein